MAYLYEIKNSANGRKYVGVTNTSIRQRWIEHLCRLNKQKGTTKFQNDFNIYGKECFSINKIAEGELLDMLVLEKFYTKEVIKDGYNCIIGGGGTDEKREAAKIKFKKFADNPEYKKMVYMKVAASRTGMKMSDESKLKMSIAGKGKKYTPEQVENRRKLYTGEGNPNYGKHRIFLNIQTGIFYETPELYNYFGVNKDGLQRLRIKKDTRLNNFIATV